MDSWRKLCRARRVDRPAGCNRLGALPAADTVSRNAVFRVRLGCLQVCVAPSLTGTCLLVPHVHSVGDTLCSRLEDMATGGGEILTVLSLADCGLVDLDGLAAFPSLRELRLANNSVADLGPLMGRRCSSKWRRSTRALPEREGATPKARRLRAPGAVESVVVVR